MEHTYNLSPHDVGAAAVGHCPLSARLGVRIFAMQSEHGSNAESSPGHVSVRRATSLQLGHRRDGPRMHPIRRIRQSGVAHQAEGPPPADPA